MGLLGVLQVIFIVLKLVEVIAWSWWLVLTPLWIGVALYFIFLIIYSSVSFAIFKGFKNATINLNGRFN